MEDFYKKHGIDGNHIDHDLVKQEIFSDIMEKFEMGVLTSPGKGGIPRKVTNEKQAYAMAMSISERHCAKHYESKNQPKLDGVFQKNTPI